MKLPDLQGEYEKNKDLRVEDISILQEWLRKQPHLPQITEYELILFFHSCYFSLEQTKLTIDKYFTYKNAWPEVFANTDPHVPKIRNDMNTGLFTVLPHKTSENYYIFYCALLDSNINKYIFKDLVKIMNMTIIGELMQRGTADGVVVVCDMNGFSVGHVLKTNIMEMKKFLTYVQNALPVRLKALHFVNVVSIADLFMPLIKPFINKELLDYLYFTDSYDKLFKYVNKELFPKDIGGNASSIKELHEEMVKFLLENKDFFIEDEKLITNEKCRDCRPSYMDKDFGIGAEGSFKKLDFD